RIAVEKNGEIVPKSRYAATRLASGDRIEIVGAVGGGCRRFLVNAPHTPSETCHADPLLIAGRAYRSRLLVGTGKYRDFAQTREAIVASGAEIVTVAIRRTNIGQDANAPSLLDALPPSEFTYLPNTAGCYTADDAVRTL